MRRLSARTTALLITLAVLIAGLGSYGAYRVWRHFYVPQTELTGAVQRDFEVNGQDVTVLTPDSPGSQARPLALVTHGYGADERILRTPYMAGLTQGLLDDGWIVASSEADGDAWGGGTSQDDYVALHEAVVKQYSISHTVMVSVSMGAIPGLNLVADERIPDLTSWVGINPVTDLPAMSTMDVWSDIIGSAVTADEIAALDPMSRTYPTDLPLYVFAAPQDTYAPPAEQVVPFADKTGAQVTECEGRHVSPDCFRPGPIAALN